MRLPLLYSHVEKEKNETNAGATKANICLEKHKDHKLAVVVSVYFSSLIPSFRPSAGGLSRHTAVSRDLFPK